MSEQFDKLNHWYGWNGGECPVHPETQVEVMLRSGKPEFESDPSNAHSWVWSHDNTRADIIAFRVARFYAEPKKPREWWANIYPDIEPCVYASKVDADHYAATHRLECVHVREVLPEEEV